MSSRTPSHSRSRLFRTTALVSLTAAFGIALFAQETLAQVAPSSAQPQNIEQRFRPQETPQQPGPSFVTTGETPPAALANQLLKIANKPFVLHAVKIDDSTVYKEGTFEPLFADKIGQRTTLNALRAAVREITVRYRTDGYALSQAVIPNQKLEGGVVHIRVVEGFVDKVIIENEHPERDRRGLIREYGNKIAAQRPLNTKTLERYMLLANDLPGVKARALLRPSGGTFGAADLVIQVQPKETAWEGSFTSDNRGNKFIGPYQEQLTVTENSAAGYDERTTVRGINTIPTR